VPTDWVKLRVVVEGSKVQIYVGPVKQLTLEVRKLGQLAPLRLHPANFSAATSVQGAVTKVI
jgi:hypothetical protein